MQDVINSNLLLFFKNIILQIVIEELKNKLANVSPNSINSFQKEKEDDNDSQKFVVLEEQVEWIYNSRFQ